MYTSRLYSWYCSWEALQYTIQSNKALEHTCLIEIRLFCTLYPTVTSKESSLVNKEKLWRNYERCTPASPCRAPVETVPEPCESLIITPKRVLYSTKLSNDSYRTYCRFQSSIGTVRHWVVDNTVLQVYVLATRLVLWRDRKINRELSRCYSTSTVQVSTVRRL